MRRRSHDRSEPSEQLSACGAIRILSATYGRNCTGYVPKTNQAPPSVREGNVTEFVQAACPGEDSNCTFRIDKRWGDPAQGCGKDLVVSYQCQDDRQSRILSIAADASKKSVKLDCNAPRQH